MAKTETNGQRRGVERHKVRDTLLCEHRGHGQARVERHGTKDTAMWVPGIWAEDGAETLGQRHTAVWVPGTWAGEDGETWDQRHCCMCTRDISRRGWGDMGPKTLPCEYQGDGQERVERNGTRDYCCVSPGTWAGFAEVNSTVIEPSHCSHGCFMQEKCKCMFTQNLCTNINNFIHSCQKQPSEFIESRTSLPWDTIHH